MLKIKSNEYLDLNRLGQFFVIFQMIFLLITGLHIGLLIAVELFLFFAFYILSGKIQSNYGCEFWLNLESNWLCKQSGKDYEVNIKDYWITGKFIFIWLYGPTKSVSFVLSRSIIGSQRYSKILSLIRQSGESI